MNIYFLAALERRWLIIFCVFLGVCAAVWFFLDMFSKDTNQAAESRLDMLNDRKRGEKNEKGKAAGVNKLTRALEKASPSLAKHLEPKTEADKSRLVQRLSEAGFRSEAAPAMFLSIKVIVATVAVVFAGGATAFTSGLNQSILLRAVLGGGIAFFLPEMVLDFLRSNRKKQITLALPDCLDLLVVSVEAGLGLDQAMRKVAEEMRGAFRILSDEIQLSTLHLQMGMVRATVLQELGSRTGVEDLRTLATLLIQADKFGSGVAQALRVQSDSMRIKRQQIAEEKAAKTAVKLIFPLVIFIFPGVFVVLVGPAAIQMAREMFPAMQGK
jgi:tight adherence protein C